MRFLVPTALLLVVALGSGAALAQNAGPAQVEITSNPEITACKATALIALKERSPAVKDLILDMDTLAIAKANTKVEDTPVRTVIMGDAYPERKGTGASQRFLCLIGEKGKVLLTFLTSQ